ALHVLYRSPIAQSVQAPTQILSNRVMNGSDDMSEKRERFIPVRKAELVDALANHGRLLAGQEREKFRQVCRMLAAIYHYETFDRLERLRNDYFYLDPELDPHARFDQSAHEAAYADLIASFTAVLNEANFVEISHPEIDAAHRQRKTMRVKVAVSVEDFREERFFRRGRDKETVTDREWVGLPKDSHDLTVHDA